MIEDTGSPPLLESEQSGATGAIAQGDFARLAVSRIAIIASLGAGLGLLSLVLSPLRVANVGARAGTERPLSVVVVGTIAWIVLALVARSPRVRPKVTIDLSLAVLVLISFLASVFAHWLPYAEGDVVRGVSPAAALMVVFAATIPVAPSRMALAAVLVVLVDVAALALTVSFLGQPTPSGRLILWLLVPDPVGAAIAVGISVFLFRVGEAVRQAREMGAYRLIKKIGQGGMGEVWRGEHRSLAKSVAIKLVSPRHFGTLDVDEVKHLLVRFEREAQATAALRSPNTIAVYDYGRASDGSFYYVMEHLEGMNLDELVRQDGPVEQARAVFLLLQMCDSLAEAHEAGLIHRDVKPANVFATDRDLVKVLDFGLVKLQSSKDSEEAKLTGAGTVLGTPAFISPEAASGHDATAASDIYAFGCVAYWLLSGTLVFQDKTQPVQQMVAHVMDEPDALSLRAQVDPKLEALVMACLAKDPFDRPTSFRALEVALRALSFEKRWSPEDAAAWWRSRRPSQDVFESAPTEMAAPVQP